MKEINVDNFSYSNVKEWIKDYSHKEKVEFAIHCAELVIDLYKGDSDAPRLAIEAAKDWVKSPTKENQAKCKKAAHAAYAAAAYADAYAAAAYADASAAHAAYADAAYADASAAHAAYAAAAYAAAHAAYADAAYADASAAHAAYAAAAYAAAYAHAGKSVKEKIIGFITSKLQKSESVLETKEPKRTKVEYVKVHNSEAIKAVMEGSIDYWCEISGSYSNLTMDSSLQEFCCAVHRIEAPIEWWEDALQFVDSSEDMNSQYNKDSDSIYLCGTFSRDEACDFSRILLEQGE